MTHIFRRRRHWVSSCSLTLDLPYVPVYSETCTVRGAAGREELGWAASLRCYLILIWSLLYCVGSCLCLEKSPYLQRYHTERFWIKMPTFVTYFDEFCARVIPNVSNNDICNCAQVNGAFHSAASQQTWLNVTSVKTYIPLITSSWNISAWVT